MRISLMQFVTDRTPPPQSVAVWAEQRGFDGLFVPEKTHVPTSRQTPWPGGELPDWYLRCYDPFVALAVAAAATTTLRVGTGACLLGVHDPVLLAKQVASVDHLSNGRFVLGVGFGWNVEELADHGVPFADRIVVAVDKLAAMRVLWASEPAAYSGPYATVPPSWAWPKPANDRDPASAQVCVYSSSGDRATLEAYRAAGVDEVVLALPSAGADDVLSALERYAPLVSAFTAGPIPREYGAANA